MSNIINTSVEIKLDENGRPSVDPADVVNLSQRLLIKSILEQTENGKSLPGDMTNLSQTIRDSSQIALLQRKIDVDAGKEDTSRDAARLAEAHRRLKADRTKPQLVVDNTALSALDAIAPPPAELGEGEGAQGMQIQIPEDFIDQNQ